MIVHQTPLLDGSHKGSGGLSGNELSGGMMTGTTPDTRRGHDVVPAIPGCTSDDCSSLNGCSGETFLQYCNRYHLGTGVNEIVKIF